MRLARLVTRSLSHHRGLLAGMSVVLAGFQVLLVTIAVNLQRDGLFGMVGAMIPPSFQVSLGGAGLATFGGFVAFGFFHPVIVLALAVAAAYLGGELAGDVDGGLVDLVAARPVSRMLLVSRSVIAVAIATAAMVALMVVANRSATWLYAVRGVGPAVPLLSLGGNLLALTWCCGSIGLAIAACARKRATAGGTAAILFIALYLLNFAAPWWRPARPVARVAPFHYFDAMPLVMGADPTRHILILLAATAVFAGTAYVVYQRRDL